MIMISPALHIQGFCDLLSSTYMTNHSPGPFMKLPVKVLLDVA
uniref:Uncharacterized protein n=1 Tax=Arundo donax TaxID=35708 RepID=A0A0A9BBT6_ARUDO